MSGHLFLGLGQADRLDCDAFLLVADDPLRAFLDAYQNTPLADVAGLLLRTRRRGPLLRNPAWPEAAPEPWVLEAPSGRGGGLQAYLSGVRQFFTAATAALGRGSRAPADRPLLGIDLAGARCFLAHELEDHTLASLLGLAAQAAAEQGIDVALLVGTRPELQRLQRLRRLEALRAWTPESDAPWDKASGDLASEVLAGRLGLVIGSLAGGPRRTQLGADFGVSLTHCLLAALPISEAISAAEDTQFERACAGAGEPIAPLPIAGPLPARRWILKAPGAGPAPSSRASPSAPGVLPTEHELLRLTMPALIRTRHLLFVGLSLEADQAVRDSFYQAAYFLRGALRGSAGPEHLLATSLHLSVNCLVNTVWKPLLQVVDLSEPGTTPHQATRNQWGLLDQLLARIEAQRAGSPCQVSPARAPRSAA